MFMEMVMIGEKDKEEGKVEALFPRMSQAKEYVAGRRKPDNFVLLLVNCEVHSLPTHMENDGQEDKNSP